MIDYLLGQTGYDLYYSWCKGSKSVVDKTTEHEELRVTVMLSVLVDRMIHYLLLWTEGIFYRKNFVIMLYLNTMRKGGGW
jgi:hypothetical protein